MSLQLRSISIYSHEGERRDVEFRLGSLNIVTGASKTGKSALLDIVDYCWGRAECTVAEGEIRKSVSWFLLHLDNSGEGILLARRNPVRRDEPAMTSSSLVVWKTSLPTRPAFRKTSPWTD